MQCNVVILYTNNSQITLYIWERKIIQLASAVLIPDRENTEMSN